MVVVVRSDTESESRTLYLSLLYLPILVVVRSDSESESRGTPPTQ